MTATDKVDGSVMAVSLAARHSFSKAAQPSIRLLAGEGVEGDAHRGVTVQHLYQKKRNPTQPNLCQVHLFAAEKLAELAQAGFTVMPGDLGENILTFGLDLLALPRGSRLTLGREAVIEVTGLRTPCSRIDHFRSGLQLQLWGPRNGEGRRERRAGVMAVVLASGTVLPGDTVRVELPPEPHQPLGPV